MKGLDGIFEIVRIGYRGAGSLFLATGMLMVCGLGAYAASPGDIFTYAGGGVGDGSITFTGDNGPAAEAILNGLTGAAVDISGNLFIADTLNNRVRKVEAGTGIITTVAGNGTAAFAGDNGPATSASLHYPAGVAVDGSGNLYVADMLNHRVRKVVAGTGIIITVAGNGTPAFAGDGGPAVSASLHQPGGVTVDGSGNLFIADTLSHRIRKVETATGIITTCAGDGTPAFAGDGGPATSASLNSPRGVTMDSSGNLFVADANNHRIRLINAGTGNITTVAGDGTQAFAGDGGPAASASLNSPWGVNLDASGNIYIADKGNNRIRKVDAAGDIATVAGDGTAAFTGDNGPATAASLYYPSGVVADGPGNLYIADGSNRVRKVIKPAATAAAITYSPDGPLQTGDTVTITAAFDDLVADAPVPRIALSGANTLAATDMTKVDFSHYEYNHTVTAGGGSVAVSIAAGNDINGVPLASSPASGATFSIINLLTLSVTVDGSGTGNVNSNPAGLTCGTGNCSHTFQAGTVEIYATPSADSYLGNWSGCDSTDISTCHISLDENRSVAVTFMLGPKAMTGGNGYNSLNEAYSAAAASATILLLDTELPESFSITGKDIILKGGFSPDFTTRSGLPTVLKGNLAIISGSLQVEGMSIR